MTAEQDLIDRAGRGEAGAFEQLAATHRPIAYRIALGILGEPDAAEDVAQDALVRLSAALPGFRAHGELKTWVYRVTLNLCRDQLRRQRRRAGDMELEAARQHPELTSEEQPERAVDFERARAAVSTAMDRLPAEQKEVLMLRFAADLPYAEIARVTRTAQGTVASRVFRALRRLGEELDPRHMEVLR